MPRPSILLASLLLVISAPLGCPRPATESAHHGSSRRSAGEDEQKSPTPSTGETSTPDGEADAIREADSGTTSEAGQPAAPAAEPAAGVETLSMDREQSKVGFAVSRATIGHIGHFERFSATLVLTDGQPTGLEISVRTGSVVADQHGLTSHLKSTDFFDVDKFPTATFTAESIEPIEAAGASARTSAKSGDATHRIHGTMRLHGVERKLEFPATLDIGPEAVVGRATLDISAKAFAIDYQGMEEELAEDQVQLEIELMFPRVAAGRG